MTSTPLAITQGDGSGSETNGLARVSAEQLLEIERNHNKRIADELSAMKEAYESLQKQVVVVHMGVDDEAEDGDGSQPNIKMLKTRICQLAAESATNHREAQEYKERSEAQDSFMNQLVEKIIPAGDERNAETFVNSINRLVCKLNELDKAKETIAKLKDRVDTLEYKALNEDEDGMILDENDAPDGSSGGRVTSSGEGTGGHMPIDAEVNSSNSSSGSAVGSSSAGNKPDPANSNPGDVDPNFMVIDNNDSSTGSMSIYGGGAESGPSNSRSNGGSNIGTGNGSGPARGLGSDFRGLGGERFNNSDGRSRPWPSTPSGIRIPRRCPPKPKLTASTIKLRGIPIPNPTVPSFATHTQKNEDECPMPPSIAEMLSDPNISEGTRHEIELSSKLFGTYFKQALGGIFQSNLDGTPIYKHTKQSSARKAKYHALVKRDSRSIRNDVNDKVCRMFYHYLQIEQEADVPQCKSVSRDVIDDWQDPFTDGHGPILNCLELDWLSGRKSEWNARAVELMALDIKAEAEAVWTHLPCYELYYWEETIWQKFRNLATVWKSHQRKCTGPTLDDFETPAAVKSRTNALKQSRGKRARQNTRRHTKFDIRKRICTAMVELKDASKDQDQDLLFWKWALEVICRLGTEGMSSDESKGGHQTGTETVCRVKIMVWRRHMDDLLQYIDRARRADTGIFTLRGSTGLRHIRPPLSNIPEGWPVSSRDAVECLPYIFYSEDWFQSAGEDARQAVLHVSRDEFEWFQLFAAN